MKVRILNAITNKKENLDSPETLELLTTGHTSQHDQLLFDKANNALHAQFALRAWPMAVSSHSVTDFEGP